MKKRFIILPKEDSTQRVINSVQKELGVKLISSAELNSKVRAKDILDKERGVLFKNLGVSIIDIEEDKLMEILKRDKSILHVERERTFRPVEEEEYLKAIRKSVETLNLQVNQLEKYLERKRTPLNPTLHEYTFNMESLALKRSNYSGKNINVAVLDTGFYAKHPDFINRKVEGKSFIDGEQWDFDGYGHGTHCTGTALGNISIENHKRYGIAYEANIFIGKVLADNGNGSTSTILDGIDWALEKKCQVISMSLGSPVGIGENPSAIFEHIGRKALEQGTLIVASSGNDSQRPDYLPRPVSSPANVESIMAISALNEDLMVANFSNAGLNAGDGGKVDISAPGVNVFSAYSKNSKEGVLYKQMSGTSMATPHVSGIVALYFEAFPTLTPAEIWLKIEKNSQELNHQQRRDVGAGLVQAI